jgi:hypothetical protein
LTFQEKPTIDEHGTYYLHANEHQMRTKDDPSCILALFMDDLVNVKSLCKTVFQPYGAKSMAVRLDNDQFFVPKFTSGQGYLTQGRSNDNITGLGRKSYANTMQ